MLSLRSILLFGLPLLSRCSASDAHATPDKDDDGLTLDDIAQWLPEESIQSALHNNLAPKYREGVFEHGKKAIEALHHSDPQLATKLVDQALHKELEKQDLRKRDNVTSSAPGGPPSYPDQSTTASSSSPPVYGSSVPQVPDSSSPVSTSTPSDTEGGGGGGGYSPTTSSENNSPTGYGDSTQTGVIVPVTRTTTNGKGKTVEQTTRAFDTTAPTSMVVNGKTVPAVIVKTTNAQGETITTASPVPTAKVAPGGSIVNGGGNGGGGNGGNGGGGDSGEYTTTDQYGESVVVSGSSNGQMVTTTDAAGKTVVMTYTPGGGGAVSQIVLQTTRLPNGQQSTITSFAVVGGETQGADNTKANPSLQNLAAPTGRPVGEMAALLGGAMGVAAFL